MKNILIIEPNNNQYGTESLEKPLGGSETVFIILTEYLKKIEEINLKIIYADTVFDHESIEYDVVIAYRDPRPLFKFNGKINAVFLQDMPNNYSIDMIRTLSQQGKLNKLIFLSHYQKFAYLEKLKNIDEGRHCLMLDNCIDLTLFDKSIKKENEFIYASAPNRGLDVLLDLWPEIHKQLPEYTLKLAGSVDMYNIESNDPQQNTERENFLQIGNELYNQEIEGVKWLGGLKHADLIKEIEKSKCLLYPSTFPETCCHVVNLALHAGCIPVTSSLGALAEKIINEDTGLIINGSPGSPEFKQEYVNRVVDLIKSGRLDRMIAFNRGNYTALGVERIAKRLITYLTDFDEYEGINTKVLGVICTNKNRNDNAKINFKNLIWYAPIDMITHELTGMPLDHARDIAASMAVNTGADWLLFLDDDIYVDKYFLIDMIKKAEDNKADVVVCNYPYKEKHCLIPTARIVRIANNKAINSYNLTEQEANDASKHRFVTAGLGAVLISTSILKKIGRPVFKTQNLVLKQTGEDSYFYNQCFMVGAKVYIALNIPIMHGSCGQQEDIMLILPQIL